MKTEITSKDYKDIYEACGWDPKAFSIVLKRLGYSDELIINDSLNSYGSPPIKSLVSVKEIRGWLDLRHTPIQDLGNLKTVGLTLDLRNTSIQDLGNLKEVGEWLDLRGTPISKKYSEEEIREMVDVKGTVFL